MKGIGDIYLAVSWRDEYKVGLEWIKQRMGGELKKTSRANSGGILLQRREVKWGWSSWKMFVCWRTLSTNMKTEEWGEKFNLRELGKGYI